MAYEVIVKEVAPEHLASVRNTYQVAELAQVMPRELGRIVDALQAEGIQPTGGVLTIYHGWDGEKVDAEIGVTIPGVFFPQDPKSEVKSGRVPGGKVAFTVHVGHYQGLHAAYEAIQEYTQAHGLELAETMWERYLTDPAVEPDPSKHVTEVYWPLKT
jgi:effector-binding domain-containing protein